MSKRDTFYKLPDSMQAVIRRMRAKREQQNSIKNMNSLEGALRILNREVPVVDCDTKDKPVFIISAGWRSGSTLLQRLICSNPNAIIWGEPYDRMSLVQTMSESLRAISEEYPKNNHLVDNFDINKLHEIWIANLYPGLSSLRVSHKNLFLSLWRDPAKELGFSTWGVKEVRFTAEHAKYLKWLFPDAKIIFLIRDPYDSWRSYRQSANYFMNWPGVQIRSAKEFGKLWARMVQGYFDGYKEMGAIFVKYEDLIGKVEIIDRIEQYVDFPLDRDVLNKRISGTFPKKKELTMSDKIQLHREVISVSRKVGY